MNQAEAKHAERQKFRLSMAIVLTLLALQLAGILPAYFVSGLGVGWLLHIYVYSS